MSSVLSTNIFQNSFNANPLVDTAIATVTGGATRLTIGPPPGAIVNQLEGRIIRVQVVHKVTGGTTTNFTGKLWWWNGVNTDLTTTTGDIAIAVTTAIAINTITGIYCITADLVWDSVSQRLMGAYDYFTTNTGAYTAKAATTVATGVTGSDKFRFFTTGIFSATNAGNVDLLTDFSVNLL